MAVFRSPTHTVQGILGSVGSVFESAMQMESCHLEQYPFRISPKLEIGNLIVRAFP